MTKFQQLPSAKGNRTQHYANLNAWMPEGKWTPNARDMLGKWWEIDEATYNEFLEMLPPIYCIGGFRLCEMLTDDITATFFKAGDGRFYCGETNAARNSEPGAITPAVMFDYITKEAE